MGVADQAKPCPCGCRLQLTDQRLKQAICAVLVRAPENTHGEPNFRHLSASEAGQALQHRIGHRRAQPQESASAEGHPNRVSKQPDLKKAAGKGHNWVASASPSDLIQAAAFSKLGDSALKPGTPVWQTSPGQSTSARTPWTRTPKQNQHTRASPPGPEDANTCRGYSRIGLLYASRALQSALDEGLQVRLLRIDPGMGNTDLALHLILVATSCRSHLISDSLLDALGHLIDVPSFAGPHSGLCLPCRRPVPGNKPPGAAPWPGSQLG